MIDKIPQQLQVFSYVIGVTVVMLGVCVIPTVLRKKPIIVACYIFWVLLVLIVMLFVSLPFLLLSTFREHHIEEFCSGDFDSIWPRYAEERAKNLYTAIEQLDDQIQVAQNHMCSKEMCPCNNINLTNWKEFPYEQALLMGSTPPEGSKPQAYMNVTERRNFYFKNEGFIETFG